MKHPACSLYRHLFAFGSVVACVDFSRPDLNLDLWAPARRQPNYTQLFSVVGSPNLLAHTSPHPPNFISLVVDHLASNGLLQSLAVFLPESGLGGGSNCGNTATVGTGPGAAPAAEAALSREDVLQALPIPADSTLFRRVIRRAEEGEGKDAGSVCRSDGETAAVPGAAAGADAAVVSNASVAVPAAGSGGHAGAASSGGGGGGSREQKRVCGLLEALVGEVATRSRAVAVDSNTQTDEAGRSHKENLGEGRGRVPGRRGGDRVQKRACADAKLWSVDRR